MAKGDRRVVGGVVYEDMGNGQARVVGYEQGEPETTPLPQTPNEAARQERDIQAGNRDQVRTDIAARGEGRDVAKTAFGQAKDLRDEYQKLPQNKEYQTVIRQYATSLKTRPNATGDQALITAYAKMLDPGSVVREQEFNTVAAGDSVIGQTVARLNKELGVDGAGMLRPEVRKRLRAEMLNLTKGYNESYKQSRQFYAGLAERNGFDPQDIIGPHVGAPYYGDIEKGLIRERTPQRKQTLGDRAKWQGYDKENGLYGTVTDEGPPDPGNGFFSGNYSPEALMRGLKQGAGSIAQGVGNIAGIVNDPINRLLQPAMGYKYQSTGEALRKSLGLPQNPNAMSNAIIQGGTGALAGAAGAGGIASALNPGTAATAARAMAANPAQQLAAGATGGGSAELARQQGYGIPAQIGAGMVGGMVGAMPMAMGARMAAQRQIEAGIPTVPQLKQKASDLYQQAEARGVTASPQMTTDLQNTIRQTMTRDGRVSPKGRISEVYPKAKEAMQLVDDYAGSSMNPTQIQTVRKVMADGLTSKDATERRIAGMLTDDFDNWANPQAPELAQARDISSRYLNAQQLEKARELASIRAGQFSQSGFENALRTEYRALDRNSVKAGGRYAADLGKAIENVSRGTPGSNTARALGRLAPTTPMSLGVGTIAPATLGTMVGGSGLGAAVGGAAMGIGTAGRTAANALSRRQADIAELIARNGGAIDQAPLIDPDTEAALAAAMTWQPANMQSLKTAPRRKKRR